MKAHLKLIILSGAVIAPLCLGGCKKPADWAQIGSPGHHGRYVGLGIYQPQVSWTKMIAAESATDTSAARPVDDQAVLVTIDSETGEMRACGDMSGYCIGLNPWSKPLAPQQVAPISLSVHATAAQGDDDSNTSDGAKTRP